MAAGMITGGIETARTGDIGKGFLAGLGAFGGANLAGSLTAAGAQQGVQAATAAGADLTAQTGSLAADNARDALLARSAETLPASVAALPTPTGLAPTVGSQYGQMAQGAQNLLAPGATGEGARAAAMGNIGGLTGLATQAGMASGPMLFEEPEPYRAPEKKKSEYKGPVKPSERRVRYPDDELRRRTSEFMYFTPSNPIPYAEGGEASSGGEAAPTPMSAGEYDVYQNIANVQQMAGLPGLDLSRFSAMPRRSGDQFVYNPVEAGSTSEEIYSPSFTPPPYVPDPVKPATPQDYDAFTAYMKNKQYQEAANLARDRGFSAEDTTKFINLDPGAYGFDTAIGLESVTPFFDTPKGPQASQADLRLFETLMKQQRFNDAAALAKARGFDVKSTTDYINLNPTLYGLPDKTSEEIVGSFFSRGGSVPMLEDGGFVLTKKAVDGLGRGSNKKGQENARRGLGAIPIKGPGTGTSDSIKTTIEGKRPALVSNGEAYVPKKQVAKRGGAKAFYALMDKAEKQAKRAKRAKRT